MSMILSIPSDVQSILKDGQESGNITVETMVRIGRLLGTGFVLLPRSAPTAVRLTQLVQYGQHVIYQIILPQFADVQQLAMAPLVDVQGGQYRILVPRRCPLERRLGLNTIFREGPRI